MSTIYDQLKQVITEHERAEQQSWDLRTLYGQMEEIVSICDEPISEVANGNKVKRIREIAAEAAGV